MSTHTQDRDALVLDIGRIIATDANVNARPWDAYALIAWYGDGLSKLNGFRYAGDAPGEPATPDAPELEDALQALREATHVPGKEPWRAAVVRLDRASGKATVEFVYDDADRWEVTPATVADIARRARCT